MSEIKVLAELDHIRKRPGMYIGDTKNPTHLIKEVLDNSLDELLNGFANSIAINYDNKGNVSIADNGRGFPIHSVTLPDGTIEDSVIVSLGRLFSGSKFDDKTYNISKGTHGVGLSAVNALSKTMSMIIKDRENKLKVYYYLFEKGNLKSKQTKILDKEIPFSTKTNFTVDPTYFNTIEFDTKLLEKEVFLISAKYPNYNIYLNDKLVPKGTMEDFVRWICGIAPTTPLFHSNYIHASTKEEISVYYTYENKSVDPVGDVNLGFCEGHFLTNFATIFYNVVKSDYDQLTRAEILNGFRYYISLKLKEPKYDSQNKIRMTKSIGHLTGTYLKKDLSIKITDKFFKNKFNELLNAKQYKIAAKYLKPKSSRVSTENPLKDCEKIPGDILYILEGDSAEGTLKEVRNAKTEAILPVNGKIINATKIGIDKAVTTKLKYMLEALGVDPSKKKYNYRYNKVKVICDADPDGLHISVLVSIAIWRFAPDLLKEGRFSIIIPPLYGASKKDKFIPIYSHKDVATYTSQGYTIKRFKGLGEMNAKELDAIIQDPLEYIGTYPKNDKEESIVYEIMTEPFRKKEICQDSRFSLETLTKLIKGTYSHER